MNQIAEVQPVNNQQVMEMVKGDFLSVSVDGGIAWEKEFKFAMQLLQKNTFLDNTAWNNTDSLKNAIINVSAIGISLNPALKHAYLVPRQSMVCLDISYMGLLHLACMSGSIMWGQAKIVREKDSYISMGIDKAPEHKYSPFGDRGAIVGVYCTVKTCDGDYLTEEMDLESVYDIRGRSSAFKNGSGPWKTDPEQMIRKTVVKRASSYWPKVDRLDAAVQMLNTDNGEGIDFDNDKPAGKSGNWKRGNNPDSLPGPLRAQYFLIKEGFDQGCLDVVCEKFDEFAMIEESEAVRKCFASDERSAIAKHRKESGYMKTVNAVQVEFLQGEDAERFHAALN